MLTITRDQLTCWKKDIEKYEKGKQKLSWKKPPPVKIVRDWEVKSKDYQFNPVLQKYNDKNLEQVAQRKEAQSREVEQMKSRARSTKYEKDYNIINFSEKPASKIANSKHTSNVASIKAQAKSHLNNSEHNIENELPINNISRKSVNPPYWKAGESYGADEERNSKSKYLKRPSAGYSRRFNPLKVVNTDIRFIDNGLLVTNPIEVKTPPPPMYEEEMEKQKEMESKPKYNKELYASSSSDLSAIESKSESGSADSSKEKNKQKKKHKKKKKKGKKTKEENPKSTHEELKLPEIKTKNSYVTNESHKSKKLLKSKAANISSSHENVKVTVHSIKSVAAELLVKHEDRKVL